MKSASAWLWVRKAATFLAQSSKAGLRLVIFGIAIGLAASLLLGRLMQTQL